MSTLADLKADAVFAMFKGEPGTRKSTAALSFAEVGPQLWFPFDGKMNSLLIPAKLWGIDRSKIEVADHKDPVYSPVKSPAMFFQRLNKLKASCPYKSIIIDSITSLGDMSNTSVLKEKSGTTTKDGKEKGLRVGGIPVNSMEDYKAEAALYTEMIDCLKEIQMFHNVNIILIAHVIGERKVNEGESTHFSRIIVTGGKILSAKLAAYCDEVYHFNIDKAASANKEGDYTFLTIHTGDDFARTALPLPSKVIFNGKPVYKDFILPAIESLNAPKV